MIIINLGSIPFTYAAGSLERICYTKWKRTIIHFTCVYLLCHVNMAAVEQVHKFSIISWFFFQTCEGSSRVREDLYLSYPEDRRLTNIKYTGVNRKCL